MIRRIATASVLATALAASAVPRAAPAEAAPAPDAPVSRTYREIDGKALQLFVFTPARAANATPLPAVLLFHGGGWSAGSAEWTFDQARRFAKEGFVALSVDYRLSDSVITPMEALSDVCAAFKWTRSHAVELGVNPDRLAAYGVSAGGHLAAAAATIGCGNFLGTFGLGGPDALALLSPAVDAAYDPYFVKLLRGRAEPAEMSPMQRMRTRMPPSIIVQGDKDNLTPLGGAQRFCDRIKKDHGRCELLVYKNLGHLLTRNLAKQESAYDPDPAAREDGLARQVRFLKELWRR